MKREFQKVGIFGNMVNHPLRSRAPQGVNCRTTARGDALRQRASPFLLLISIRYPLRGCDGEWGKQLALKDPIMTETVYCSAFSHSGISKGYYSFGRFRESLLSVIAQRFLNSRNSAAAPNR